MKFKTSLTVISALVFFCISGTAFAMTETELQTMIAQLQAQIAQLQAQLVQTQNTAVPTPATIQTSGGWCFTFNKNLVMTNSGVDVKNLQIALEKEGFVISAEEKTQSYFDSSTRAAAKKFQEKYSSEILTPYGLSSGTGGVGAKTRDKLNALYGCGLPSITVTSPNGYEKWTEGSTQTITWISKNIPDSSLMNIYLTTARDGDIKLASINNGLGKFSFVVSPSIISEIDSIGYKIKITTVYNGKLYKDYSDNYFDINALHSSLTIISPNGEQIFNTGDTMNIQWTYQGFGSNVRGLTIELIGDISFIITDEALISLGSYSWKIPLNNPVNNALISGNYKIRIRYGNLSSGIIDYSDNYFTIVAQQTCTPNWYCGNWSSCVNGQQTRTCTDSNNCGVITNKPTITQSCVNVCTPDWYCGNWSYCVNGQQTRTCTDFNNCGVMTNKPATTQSCTNPIVCSPSWTCDSWSSCVNNQQTRICTDSNNCGTTTGKPATTQSCTSPIVCSPSWTCGEWNACLNNQQTRICTDSNNCGTTTGKPVTTQSCVNVCSPNWTCDSWSSCINNQQTRICTDFNNCGVMTNKPTMVQSCVSPVQSFVAVTSPNGGERWSQKSTKTITWTTNNISDSSLIVISFVNYFTNAEHSFLQATTNGKKQISFMVPPNLPANKYKVKVGTVYNGYYYYDLSDNYFTITIP